MAVEEMMHSKPNCLVCLLCESSCIYNTSAKICIAHTNWLYMYIII